MKTLTALAAIAAAMLLATAPARADALDDILDRGVVRIGVPLDVPPFGYQDEDRNPVGFDVEMAELVASYLGVELELQQITGANRIPFLITDKVDIVISVMGLTPERAKQIMFTAPYVNTFVGVFGPADIEVGSADELGDLRVAAARGTTQDILLSGMNPDAQLVRTEDDATAAAAYLSGQADLLATADIVAVNLAEQNPDAEFEVKFVILRAPAHMGVRMGEHDLRQWLDSLLFYIKGSTDELEALHRKYLDVSMGEFRTL